jgi:hypothetical protein
MRSIVARLGLLLVVFSAVGAPGVLAAQADPTGGGGLPGGPPPGFGTNQANFCRGTYALCITAQCAAVPTLDRLGNYYVTHALCECDVIEDSEASPAWSMGPGSCEDHGPVEQGGREFLISTYSNLYNDANKEVQCGKDTLWAWCYGAPCVVDDEDPSKALCNCPLVQSAANLLVSDCSDSGYCGQIWSAAVPPGDCFANCRYYEWMTGKGYPTNPPANLCSTGEPLCACPKPPMSGS